MSPEQVEIIANHIADFSLAYLRAAPVKAAIQTANKPQRSVHDNAVHHGYSRKF